ncbi:MAG: M43 family zinc metalloprotease [Ginsengibacter sp.]
MKIIYSLLMLCAIWPCSAQRICATYDYVQKQPQQLYKRPSLQNAEGAGRDTLPGEVITVPVVIHLLYNNAIQNITDIQILSQLEALNKDYRRLNNVQNIPDAFATLAADSKIVFCLAKTDPSGKPANGIIHKFTKTANWLANDAMKFSASGGDDAWDSKRYLNIWVCNLFGKNLGYSSLPGSPADKDGVVIQYDVFGTTGIIRAPFDKGRTATHEVGHWLGLMHLWGDALCGDDMIGDTPPQKSYNNGCPSFPHASSCSINENGDMFMNFMDFTDDACMSMFSKGQVNKMRSMFATGNVRNSFLHSSECNSVLPETGSLTSDSAVTIRTVIIYPNPAKSFINIEAKENTELIGKTLKIFTVSGTQVKAQSLTSQKNIVAINNLAEGVYIVKIGEGKEIKIMRFVKQ